MSTKAIIYIGLVNLLIAFSCVKQNEKEYTYAENLDLLCKVIDEKHCYLDEKDINWDSLRQVYAEQIDDSTDDFLFFDICSQLLDELKDGHTGIASEFNSHSYSKFYLDYEHNFNYNIVERNYLNPKPLKAGGFMAQKIDQMGYLYYGSFMDFTGREYLSKILEQLGDIQGLIIDIRNNTGGMIAMADTIASCFVSQEMCVGYTSYKEGPGHQNFSELYPHTIGPEDSSKVVYDGKIVLLTNRLVYSAANTFASVMSSLPNVTIIGDTTGGGGGMPTSAELYNGWQVWTATNPMYDVNKRSIEKGITPDIRVDLSKDDEYVGIDTIIEAAIRFLKSNE